MTEPTPAAPAEKEFKKLGKLREVEQEVQGWWAQEGTFDVDAPAASDESSKWFGTFPYPYMNGRLHLGHTFSLTKVEFAAQYERLKGKNVLFPFAFHCTGMPIAACADKLRREIEDFGNPPVFPAEVVASEESSADSAADAAAVESKGETDLSKHSGKKTKVAQKSGGSKYQWDIMRSNDVPEGDIHKFADAKHWLGYFPPHCKADLQKMGVGVDWRRSFITTDVNPYYDSFIRWQFTQLHEQNRIKFGKRYSVYSPKDGQPCMDHDRSKGEGIGPQEYTLIKLEMIEPLPAALKELEGKYKVFLVAGTLRPETMYGQTNCWVLPTGTYGAFATNVAGEAIICSDRAAHNLAFQDASPEVGKVVKLAQISGQELLGCPLKAPLSKYEKVYTLPMNTISMSKGTGVVTSVPSDSPDDYVNLAILKKKADYRAKYSLKDEMVLPFDVVSIIECPTLGNICGQTACEKYKIESPNQRVELDKAKEECYKEGFYQGKMTVGEHAGKLVSEAKPLVRDGLMKSGLAMAYAEPNGQVISRSGDECVVALVDQWYLNYGEPTWQKEVMEHLDDMNFFSAETRKRFDESVDWLHEWACSRSYGLGTRLPFAPEYLVDSLSDSTIYMAFYTIAHLLHQGSLDGSTTGSAGIKPEQMTRPVWDFIFHHKDYPTDCGIPEATLLKLRQEFEYWYPVDLRVSGKDLIGNHLVFFLYNHLAIWGKSMAPKAIRANGFVLLNEAKMSKSEGNFLTVSDGVDQFSADGMRLTLADAGDSLEDANFNTKNANASILKLHTHLEWAERILTSDPLADKTESRPKDSWNFDDRAFDARISKCIVDAEAKYDAANFREAAIAAFVTMNGARDAYRVHCESANIPMEISIIRRFIETMSILLAPITPHLSEYIWRKLLKNTGSVLKGTWPKNVQLNSTILAQDNFVQESIAEFRKKVEDWRGLRKKGAVKPPPSAVEIVLAAGYPDWMIVVLKGLAEEHKGLTEAKAAGDMITKFKDDAVVKKAMRFASKFIPFRLQMFRDTKDHSVFSHELPFDELALVTELAPVYEAALGDVGTPVKVTARHATEKEAEKVKPGEPFLVIHA